MAALKKYNPGTDVVAGRTASQIERAKRQAVGGGRKRCVKGKSCSATCIAANKICLVEIPWVAAQGIPKVVAQIQKVSASKKEPSAVPASVVEMAKSMYKTEWSKQWKAMNVAISNNDKQSYNLHKDSITKYHKKLTDKGIPIGPLKIPEWKTPKPVILPSVRPSVKPSVKPESEAPAKAAGGGKPGFNKAKGKAPALNKINSAEDFAKVEVKTGDSNKGLLAIHQKITDIFKGVDMANTAVRNFLINAVGGEKNFLAGLKGISGFTGTAYENIRAAQHAAMGGKKVPSYLADGLKRAKNIEKLIAVLPKDAVVKYRGIRVEPAQLMGIIAASQGKEAYKDGALASWSTSLETAKGFSDGVDYVKSERVIFQTVNRRGVAVEGISSIKDEYEVLTSGTAKYRHTGNYRTVDYDGGRYHIFDVIES